MGPDLMVPVVKAHAYGNDFLLVPATRLGEADGPAFARAACQRTTGVGADGLILYAVHGNRLGMTLFNADGSPSAISGNGLRCLAAYGLFAGLIEDTGPRVQVETGAGLRTLDLVAREGSRWTFRSAMGAPADIRQLQLDAAGERVPVVALSVGNPQCVVFGPLDPVRLHRLGPALEHHPAFPDRTNVSFVHVEAPDRLRILIWERGVGPTSASGTGACGAAAAAIAARDAARTLDVISPGGTQRVEWLEDGLYLTGWAEIVFEGCWLAEIAPRPAPAAGNPRDPS